MFYGKFIFFFLVKTYLTKTIGNLKNKKVAGLDGLENEAIKNLRISLVKPLTKLFNQILHNGLIPKQWLISLFNYFDKECIFFKMFPQKSQKISMRNTYFLLIIGNNTVFIIFF